MTLGVFWPKNTPHFRSTLAELSLHFLQSDLLLNATELHYSSTRPAYLRPDQTGPDILQICSECDKINRAKATGEIQIN